MLTCEGSCSNSLIRRPPWLHACSVKNKQTNTNLLMLSSCNQVTNSSGILSKLPTQRIWILEMKWSWIWVYLITKEWISGKHYLFIGTQIGQTSLQHHPLFIKMSYEHCLSRKLINEINLKLFQCWSVYNRKYHIKTTTRPYRCNAHGSYKWIIMNEKCGRLDSNEFQLKWRFGIHGNRKNQIRFVATS